jgi:hypothetical protein
MIGGVAKLVSRLAQNKFCYSGARTASDVLDTTNILSNSTQSNHSGEGRK